MNEITKFGYVMIIALILSSVFNYLYQVVMGIMLPKNAFGVLGVLLSVLYIASVLTQSTFSWTGTRRLSLKLDRSVFKTTLIGNLTLASLAAVVIVIVTLNSKTYLLAGIIVATVIVLTAISSSYVSLLRAVKRFYHIATANVMFSVLKLLFAVSLVYLGFGVVGALLAMMLSTAMVVLFLYRNARDLDLIESHRFEFNMVIETFYISLVFLSISFLVNSSVIFERVVSNSDVLAGVFNASLTIARGVFFITSALVTVLFPYVSSGDSCSEEYAFQLIKYFILFVFPICIVMAVNPKAWLVLFFGSKYLEGADLLKVLSVGIGFTSLAFVLSSNLVAFGDSKFPAKVLVIASVVQLVMAIFGYPAESVVLSAVLATIVLITHYFKTHYLKISPTYIMKISLAYTTLFVACLIDVTNRLSSLLLIAVVYVIYVLILAVLKLFDEKDVEVLFSPLPTNLMEKVRAVVVNLNRIAKDKPN